MSVVMIHLYSLRHQSNLTATQGRRIPPGYATPPDVQPFTNSPRYQLRTRTLIFLNIVTNSPITEEGCQNRIKGGPDENSF